MYSRSTAYILCQNPVTWSGREGECLHTFVPAPTRSPHKTQLNDPNTSGAPPYSGIHHASKYHVPSALNPTPATNETLSLASGPNMARSITPDAPNTRPVPTSSDVVDRCSKKAPNADSTGVNMTIFFFLLPSLFFFFFPFPTFVIFRPRALPENFRRVETRQD